MALRPRPALALGALAFGGCFVTPEQPPAPEIEAGGSAGIAGASGTGGASSGSSSTGGTAPNGGAGGVIVGPEPTPTCGSQTGAPVLCDQRVFNALPAHRELYTWTTPEQVAELRSGGRLLIVGQSEALGRGYAFTAIDELAAASEGVTQSLLTRLSSELFQFIRYAWPHPWATRMGWPDESYGNELVRVVLKPGAWIASVRQGAVSVADLDNQAVPLEEALANAERIAAIFFEKDAASGGPDCISGSFEQAIGSGGYREFILGNEAMIEEWSVATAEIRTRMEADIARLRAFLEHVRGGPTPESSSFNADVLCSWQWGPTDGELGAYQSSLAIPSELYIPSSANIATLIDTLTSDLFEPDPLVVRPGG